MTFREWFDANYRRPDESVSRATARFQAEFDFSYPTIFYALRGSRMSPDAALRIEKITGGQVSVASLVIGPTRRETKAAS